MSGSGLAHARRLTRRMKKLVPVRDTRHAAVRLRERLATNAASSWHCPLVAHD
jgi:hypothetical protein